LLVGILWGFEHHLEIMSPCFSILHLPKQNLRFFKSLSTRLDLLNNTILLSHPPVWSQPFTGGYTHQNPLLSGKTIHRWTDLNWLWGEMRSGRGKNKTERGRGTGKGRDYREKRNSSDVYTTHSSREGCILTEGKHIWKKSILRHSYAPMTVTIHLLHACAHRLVHCVASITKLINKLLWQGLFKV